MTLHTYTPQPMSLPSMNFLHLTVSEIQPRQTISRRPPAHPDTMGENNKMLVRFQIYSDAVAYTPSMTDQNESQWEL